MRDLTQVWAGANFVAIFGEDGLGFRIRIFVSFYGTSAELLSVRHRNENRMMKMFFIGGVVFV